MFPNTHYTIINISFSFQKQKTGRKVSLSEQYLLDCAYNSIEASNPETGGCNGAWPEEYLYYASQHHNGQDQLEENEPYMAFTYGWCSAGSENRNEGNCLINFS